jgi:hypothetical protein
MREFVVTLRCGKRYTIKAERFRFESGYLALLITPSASVASNDPFAGVVGLFEQSQVVTLVDREHLVSEEKCDSTSGPYVVGSADDCPIPF